MFDKRVNFYDVLGVSQNATQDEIKKSFRTLAAQHHPDKNPGDVSAESKFKQVNEAFQILSDDSKRAEYDAFLSGKIHNFDDFFGKQSSSDHFWSDAWSSHFNVDDVIRDFIRNQNHENNSRDVRTVTNIQKSVTISLAEAACGCKKEFHVDVPTRCVVCMGSGVKPKTPGANPATCQRCKGVGNVSINHGFMFLSSTCNLCNGTGFEPGKECGSCSGGVVSSKRTLIVAIPAGIDNGQTVKITNRTLGGNDLSWDLYVSVSVGKHHVFTRKENDLHTKLNISLKEMFLGCTVQLEKLDGKQCSVVVPPMTEPGKTIVIKSEGVPKINTNRKGDLHVFVGLNMPSKEKLNDESVVKLINELDQKLND